MPKETFVNNHIQGTLVIKWEKNRCEQNYQIMQAKEDELVKSICLHSVKKDFEQIAIAEIESKNHLYIIILHI